MKRKGQKSQRKRGVVVVSFEAPIELAEEVEIIAEESGKGRSPFLREMLGKTCREYRLKKLMENEQLKGVFDAMPNSIKALMHQVFVERDLSHPPSVKLCDKTKKET